MKDWFSIPLDAIKIFCLSKYLDIFDEIDLKPFDGIAIITKSTSLKAFLRLEIIVNFFERVYFGRYLLLTQFVCSLINIFEFLAAPR